MPWLIALLIMLMLFFGPRVKVDTRLRPVELPPDLDTYLRAAEARFDDLVPGTEKEIIWAGPAGEQTEYAVIYLHGFSASRGETAPLSDEVAAALGANLFYTRLTGHGRTGAALGAATVNDWLNDTMEALAIGRRIGRRLIFICVSTGATLATWLAVQHNVDDVAAMIFVSPNFGIRDGTARILTLPWGRQVGELLAGKEIGWEPRSPEHARAWTNRYPLRALLPMQGLVQLVDNLDLSAFTRPLLTIYSPRDRVLDVRQLEKTYVRLGSRDKRLVPYSKSRDPNNHVIVGAITSPETTVDLKAIIMDFLGELD